MNTLTYAIATAHPYALLLAGFILGSLFVMVTSIAVAPRVKQS